MLNKLQKKVFQVIDFVSKKPILIGFFAGLYPLGYFYNSNFTLLNSWVQLFYFIATYLGIPAISIYLLHQLFIKVPLLNKYSKYVFPVLSLITFSYLIIASTIGFNKGFLVVVVAGILGFLLQKHFKKILLFQMLLAIIIFWKLIPNVYKQLTYSAVWMEQPDNIETTIFKKKPNIYVIQPDGYASFSELENENYNINNQIFENFLIENQFKLYRNFRSNYSYTLSSNSSMFAMKHHYYNRAKAKSSEMVNSRKIIAGDNPVISILKNNNYKTSLILQNAYFLINRPTIKYDFCNVNKQSFSYFPKGSDVDFDVTLALQKAMSENKENPNFYFIEKYAPGHINSSSATSLGKDKEREQYVKNLYETNNWIQETVSYINENDTNSLIIIIADHGGYVGYDYTMQCLEKQNDPNLVSTIFSTALAIKWPNNEPPIYDDKLKTHVNLFRVLFSYLSENETFLQNLEKDKSYGTINSNSHHGVYELISEKGEVVFNKI